VLLVEDEPVNAAVAEGYLVALGCTTVWAKDGTTALGRSSSQRFDLVLMDLNMPDMDGYSTAALLRKREDELRAGTGKPRVPIVALTAHDPRQAREKCLAAGMDDVLGKPFTFAECESLLARWLGERGSGGREVPKIAALGEDGLSSIDQRALARLCEMRAGQAGSLFERLVGLFASSSSETLMGLRKALSSEDLHAAAALCHKLKSSAANVGAASFARCVKQMEERCLQGDTDRARELFAALSEAHPLLLQNLRTVDLRVSA
jgi:CheY-like chemotaxis protein/HPt (histidine-containing phosphotransfer) domain-containing protein